MLPTKKHVHTPCGMRLVLPLCLCLDTSLRQACLHLCWAQRRTHMLIC